MNNPALTAAAAAAAPAKEQRGQVYPEFASALNFNIAQFEQHSHDKLPAQTQIANADQFTGSFPTDQFQQFHQFPQFNGIQTNIANAFPAFF